MSRQMLVFTEALKGLPVGVDRWIDNGRSDSLKEVIIAEVVMEIHHHCL